MISLRNFTNDDAEVFQQKQRMNVSLDEIKAMFVMWGEKAYAGKYFEMFAVVKDGEIVGSISLYQHSSEVVSIGPEVFYECRRKGFAKEAMLCACQMAKEKGFKIVAQQIQVNNVASIALHRSLGFETNGLIYTNAKGNEVSIYLKCLM